MHRACTRRQGWMAGIYMCIQAEMRRVYACNGEIVLVWDAVICLAGACPSKKSVSSHHLKPYLYLATTYVSFTSQTIHIIHQRSHIPPRRPSQTNSATNGILDIQFPETCHFVRPHHSPTPVTRSIQLDSSLCSLNSSVLRPESGR